MDDNGDQIAVDEEQLVAMVESGQLGSENLLWREDFDEWLTCGNVFPDAFSEKETEPKKPRLLMGDAVPAYTVEGSGIGNDMEPQLIRHLSAPLYRVKGYMKFLGVLNMLSFWMIIPIIAGLRLFKAADCISRAHVTGDREEFIRAQEAIRSFFNLMAWMAFLAIALLILQIISIFVLVSSIPEDKEYEINPMDFEEVSIDLNS